MLKCDRCGKYHQGFACTKPPEPGDPLLEQVRRMVAADPGTSAQDVQKGLKINMLRALRLLAEVKK